MYPPIGKLTRIATGHSHIRRAVLIQSPGVSMEKLLCIFGEGSPVTATFRVAGSSAS